MTTPSPEAREPKAQAQAAEVTDAQVALRFLDVVERHFMTTAANAGVINAFRIVRAAISSLESMIQTEPVREGFVPKVYSPNNPPPCKRKGESVEDYRIRCGWDAPAQPVSTDANDIDEGALLRLADTHAEEIFEDGQWRFRIDGLMQVIADYPALSTPSPEARETAEPARQKRLIGWRTADYTEETADQQVARNWAPNVGALPIFEGDPNTKLPVASATDTWPIVKIKVQNDKIVDASFYTPGLPDGEHDLWPCPVSQAEPSTSLEEKGQG